jgi:hypothetical protein
LATQKNSLKGIKQKESFKTNCRTEHVKCLIII